MFFALVAFLALLLVTAFVFPPSAYGSSIFYVSISFSAAALILASWHAGQGHALSYLGLSASKKEIPSLLFRGLLLAIVCVAITWIVSGILMLAGLLDTENVFQKISILPPAVMLIAFTLAPLGEELLFRGFMFRYIWESFDPKQGKGSAAWLASAFLTSFVFAFLHAGYGSIAELAVAFIIGMALCFSVKRSNSLIPAIVAHACFNLLSLISMSLF